MSTANRLAKNTLILSFSNLIVMMLGLAYTMYTTRYLGPEGFGVITFALAFTNIFGTLVDLGQNALTVREVARNKTLARKYLGNLIVLKLILIILTLAVVTIAINLETHDKVTIAVVYLIYFSIMISAFTGIFNAMFQAFERIEFISAGNLLSSGCMLLGAMYAIRSGFDVTSYAVIYIFSTAVVVLYSALAFYKWIFRSAPQVDRSMILPTVVEALPFGLTALFGMIYTYADSIMLSYFQGNEVVGWYNASYRLVIMMLFIPNVINVVVYPVMSRFYTSSPSSLKLLVTKYFKFMLILALPMGIGTQLIADKIIMFVAGASYGNSVLALKILIWTTVLTFAGAAFVRLLESTNRQRIITKLSLVCVAVNILLNLILIPHYSYIGSSIAAVSREVVLVGSIMIIAYRSGYGIPLMTLKDFLLKILFSCLVMGIFVWYFHSLHLIALIALAGIVYAATLYLVRGFDEEDIVLLRQAIGR